MEETIPKPFAFVLMPFGEEFTEIYKLGIKEACKNAGAYCERVDEQIFVESILERIYNQIAKADIIIADMTGRNPNVFYETGYAHALNKQVILLTQKADDIPFDLKHYPHIVYLGKIIPLKEQLETKIRWIIENPKQTLSNVDVDLQFYINGVPLIDGPVVEVSSFSSAAFKIDMHNPTNRVIEYEVFKLALIMPKYIWVEVPESITGARLPNERLLYNINWATSLFPEGWGSIKFQVGMNPLTFSEARGGVITLRMFTQLGPTDFDFFLTPKR